MDKVMENSKNKKFKRGFSLVESINLEGLALSEDEKYDIRQYIKNILLKSNVVDVKPDKVQYNEPKRIDCEGCQGTGNFYRNDVDGDFLRCDFCGGCGYQGDVDGYDVYGKTVDGYTHLETVRFEDKD
jgi:hypothetical protein